MRLTYLLTEQSILRNGVINLVQGFLRVTIPLINKVSNPKSDSVPKSDTSAKVCIY